MSTIYNTLPYQGAKSFTLNGGQIGHWIIGCLGQDESPTTYVEPFAGMCSVLLHRPISSKEIINDLDGHVSNWWTVVRDQHEVLAEKLRWTPMRSRTQWMEATELLKSGEGDSLERALAFTVAVTMGYSGNKSSFAVAYDTRAKHPHKFRSHAAKQTLSKLADRMLDVQIENMCALKLIGKLEKRDQCLVYCDPPYRHTNNEGYDVSVDHSKLAQLLMQQTGRVAVSGYPDDFPELDEAGWHKHELEVVSKISHIAGAVRTETLWMNYNTKQGTLW